MRTQEELDKMLKVGDKVKFYSGNFRGLIGVV